MVPQDKDKESLTELSALGLSGYSVKTMAEVFKTNEDGFKTETYALLDSFEIAEALIETLPDHDYYRVQSVWVLTNGSQGFVLSTVGHPFEASSVIKEHEALAHIKDAAIAKLSPATRKILSFNL